MTRLTNDEKQATAQEILSLDRFRRAYKVTLDTLAGRHGCSKQQISQILRGETPISRAELKLLRARTASLAHAALAAPKPPKECSP